MQASWNGGVQPGEAVWSEWRTGVKVCGSVDAVYLERTNYSQRCIIAGAPWAALIRQLIVSSCLKDNRQVETIKTAAHLAHPSEPSLKFRTSSSFSQRSKQARTIHTTPQSTLNLGVIYTRLSCLV